MAGDVALGYSIMQGLDGIDPFAIHAYDTQPANVRVAGRPLRVGWISDEAFGPIDPEITAAVKLAAAHPNQNVYHGS